MCGFVGYVGSDEQAAIGHTKAMLRRIGHRGPDDEGIETRRFGRDFVSLGFRRLAILDLSPRGHQPMEGVSSSLLVFNGEIYNHRELRRRLESEGHRFVGNSDTETLLKWLETRGDAGLADLQGMFALAWLDKRNHRLLLARDPFGIKPLYFTESRGRLAFGSEVRGVLEAGIAPRRISRSALASALAFGAVQRPMTLIEGIKEFPPGCAAIVTPEAGMQTPTPYYRNPDVDELAEIPEASEIRKLVSKSVQAHMASDVPLGILLSSGLDSTVLAIACRNTPDLRCFTLGFKDNPAESEMTDAAAIAGKLGLIHEPIWLDGDEAIQQTRNWLDAIDQPSVDGLNIYAVTKAVRKAGVKVALSGLGSDELFGGYPSFSDVPKLHRWMRRFGIMPAGARIGLASLASIGRGKTVRRKMCDIAKRNGDAANLYFQRRRLLNDLDLRSLGLSHERVGLSAEYQHPDAMPEPLSSSDIIPYISRLESRYYQGNMLLRDADVCSMANGLELRVPFLHPPLANKLLSLPGKSLLPDGTPNKHLLRQAFAKELSECWNPAPKRGFVLPIRKWMLGPLAETAANGLDHLKKSGAVRAEAVDQIWSDYRQDPDSPAWTRALMLVVVGHYIAKHGLS